MNLERYGQKEKKIHTIRKVSERWATRLYDSLKRESPPRPLFQRFGFRMINFVYGPEPEARRSGSRPPWFFEFWNTVEHPERNIPGAWDEDADSKYDYYG